MGCLFVLISPFVVYGLGLIVLPEAVLGSGPDPWMSGDTAALLLAICWFVMALTAMGGMED